MEVKMYNYSSTAQLEKNFNVSEFRCKCGVSHPIQIAPKFISHLQRLTETLGADKVYIISGHRCQTHDRKVGGNGRGQHTLGYAADCQFWKNGSIIDPKLVACKAQDLGFKGIAVIGNIGQKICTNIHLDDSPTRKWYGDETVKDGTKNSVTKDFYEYYGFKKGNAELARELQHILNAKGQRLTVDGIIGSLTINAARKYTINLGDEGPLVKWVQKVLNDVWKYNCGVADGICGEKTFKAINDFQSDANLGVGYFGGHDWNELLSII